MWTLEILWYEIRLAFSFLLWLWLLGKIGVTDYVFLLIGEYLLTKTAHLPVTIGSLEFHWRGRAVLRDVVVTLPDSENLTYPYDRLEHRTIVSVEYMEVEFQALIAPLLLLLSGGKLLATQKIVVRGLKAIVEGIRDNSGRLRLNVSLMGKRSDTALPPGSISAGYDYGLSNAQIFDDYFDGMALRSLQRFAVRQSLQEPPPHFSSFKRRKRMSSVQASVSTKMNRAIAQNAELLSGGTQGSAKNSARRRSSLKDMVRNNLTTEPQRRNSRPAFLGRRRSNSDVSSSCRHADGVASLISDSAKLDSHSEHGPSIISASAAVIQSNDSDEGDDNTEKSFWRRISSSVHEAGGIINATKKSIAGAYERTLRSIESGAHARLSDLHVQLCGPEPRARAFEKRTRLICGHLRCEDSVLVVQHILPNQWQYLEAKPLLVPLLELHGLGYQDLSQHPAAKHIPCDQCIRQLEEFRNGTSASVDNAMPSAQNTVPQPPSPPKRAHADGAQRSKRRSSHSDLISSVAAVLNKSPRTPPKIQSTSSVPKSDSLSNPSPAVTRSWSAERNPSFTENSSRQGSWRSFLHRSSNPHTSSESTIMKDGERVPSTSPLSSPSNSSTLNDDPMPPSKSNPVDVSSTPVNINNLSSPHASPNVSVNCYFCRHTDRRHHHQANGSGGSFNVEYEEYDYPVYPLLRLYLVDVYKDGMDVRLAKYVLERRVLFALAHSNVTRLAADLFSFRNFNSDKHTESQPHIPNAA